MPKKYSTLPLGKLRKRLGLTQPQAASLLELSHFSVLAQLEQGERQASPAIMSKMAEVYGPLAEKIGLRVTRTRILRYATQTFENGRTMRKHRMRQAKVAALQKSA